MCLLPFPLVETFFSDAGALYLVLLSRADLLWISCLDWRHKWHTQDIKLHLLTQLQSFIVYQTAEKKQPMIYWVFDHFKSISKVILRYTIFMDIYIQYIIRIYGHGTDVLPFQKDMIFSLLGSFPKVNFPAHIVNHLCDYCERCDCFYIELGDQIV